MAEKQGSAEGSLTANGQTDVVVGRGSVWVAASGVFDTSTVTWQVFRNGAWRPITDDGTDVAFTADNDQIIDFPAHATVKVRGDLTSAGASTDVDWSIVFGVPRVV